MGLYSSAGAGKHLSDTMGMYVRENYLIDGKLVYKHKEREWFLYHVGGSNGYWMVRKNILRLRKLKLVNLVVLQPNCSQNEWILLGAHMTLLYLLDGSKTGRQPGSNSEQRL